MSLCESVRNENGLLKFFTSVWHATARTSLHCCSRVIQPTTWQPLLDLSENDCNDQTLFFRSFWEWLQWSDTLFKIPPTAQSNSHLIFYEIQIVLRFSVYDIISGKWQWHVMNSMNTKWFRFIQLDFTAGGFITNIRSWLNNMSVRYIECQK